MNLRSKIYTIKFHAIICAVLFFIFSLSCNNNSNSIQISKFNILYEKDAILHFPVNRTPFLKIDCPSTIDPDSVISDSSNCICNQTTGWQNIDDLSDIKLINPSMINTSYIWLKGKFKIDNNPDDYSAIYLDYFHGREIIYINNRLIAARKIVTIGDLHLPSQYQIPAGILVKGENIIDIRLGLFHYTFNPEIFIQTKQDFEKTKSWDIFRFRDIYFYYNLIFIFLALMIVVQIIIDRREKTRYLMLFALLLYIASGFLMHIPLQTINISLSFICVNSLVYVYVLLFTLFFQMQYEKYLTKENIIFHSGITISIFLYIINGTVIRTAAYYNVITVLIWLFCFTVAGNILYKLIRIKPDKFKKYFFSSILATYAIITLLEIILFTSGFLYWPRQLTANIFPFYLLMFVTYSTFESKKKRIQIEQLYSKLERQKPDPAASLTITDSSEEKLQRVIDFIRKNYSEDLSREGLASAVDMNPNYLSSLFNIYTGKKIQEYINTLRVRDAAELVIQSDKKIIDIAYSVGFTNLSTFNKAFKKETGKTPIEFRKNKGYSFIV